MYAMVGLVLLAAVPAIYLLPTIIGWRRKRRNNAPLFIINLFFGWMLVPYIICLAWSFSD